MTYRSSKTYGHEVGLTATFRQWRAEHSHCRFLHGYALAVHLEFEAEELDNRNWVVDFGSLKVVKEWLQDTFDHKTLVAFDDPALDTFKQLDRLGLIQLVLTEHVGCEAFAELIRDYVEDFLSFNDLMPRVRLNHVRVSEHGANSAVCTGSTV